MRRLGLISFLTAALLAMGLGLLGLSWRLSATATHPLKGVTVGGYAPDLEQSFSDWLDRQRQQHAEGEVNLTYPEDSLSLRARELGILLDVASTLERARAVGHRGGFGQRFSTLLSAMTKGIDVPYEFRLDREKARSFLERLKPWVYRAPIDAKVDIARHQRIASQPGRELDVEGTLESIEQGLHGDWIGIPLRFRTLLPQRALDSLSHVDVTAVLSEYETDFARRAGTRARNIRLAAAALDGQVVPPGDKMSFNRVVGPRRMDRGYLEAPVIVDDELEKGVGGGVCQVASTVHAAALLGGLEVLERRSHSRPSGYAPLGLDATVIDGEIDLVLKNPYTVPVLIHTSFPSTYRLRVEWLGLEPEGKLEHVGMVARRHEYYRRVTVHPELPQGTVDRRQKGGYGYDVLSVIYRTTPEGRKEIRRYRSKYWPVPEVFWVASDVDASSLPPLPEGALGLEPAEKEGPSSEGELNAAAN